MKLCPHCGEPLDARGAKWRVRVRLYEKNAAEPIADSDPERPAAEAGEAVIHSLPLVAEHVAALVQGHHAGAVVQGMEMERLRKSLKSLRPTLSRRGGDGTWRIQYTVTQHGVTFDYLARVDVVRETPARHGKPQ